MYDIQIILRRCAKILKKRLRTPIAVWE